MHHLSHLKYKRDCVVSDKENFCFREIPSQHNILQIFPTSSSLQQKLRYKPHLNHNCYNYFPLTMILYLTLRYLDCYQGALVIKLFYDTLSTFLLKMDIKKIPIHREYTRAIKQHSPAI